MPKIVTFISTILVIIGGLNWGLVGIFDFNLVDYIFREVPIFERITYIVVGLAALWMLLASWGCCKKSK